MIIGPSLESAIEELQDSSLIDVDGDKLFVHKSNLESFICTRTPDKRQEDFNAAASVINAVFPRQVNGQSLRDRWEEYHAPIQHGLSLATIFAELKATDMALEPSPEVEELWKNCAW